MKKDLNFIPIILADVTDQKSIEDMAKKCKVRYSKYIVVEYTVQARILKCGIRTGLDSGINVKTFFYISVQVKFRTFLEYNFLYV